MPDQDGERQLFVVVGGTGDLMRRKLLPALYQLAGKGPMRGKVHLLAAARNASYTDESYRTWARAALAEVGLAREGADSSWCDDCVHYQSLGQERPEDFRRLAQRIQELEREYELPGNRVLDVAIPPLAFSPLLDGLAAAGLNESPGWTRIVVEKPFGSDLASAVALNAQLHRFFDETQIYRIDHYLGKETVQNLLAFRFVNAIFESLWNRDRIASVHITVSEKVGVGRRGDYFDQVGTVRDMVQNHLTQLLAVTAMEMPVAMDSRDIRDEKVKVLRAVDEVTPEAVVLGQYTAGQVAGEAVPGYLEEPRVPEGSGTETFAALRLNINNWRWYGVPFYLRTGKRLPERLTQISVQFNCPLLQCLPPFICNIDCNRLVITLEPHEGFELCFQVKRPGEQFVLDTQKLSFRYADVFGPLRDAYETLLHDVMRGDPTFFVRADEIEASWRIYDAVLQQRPVVQPYPAGTWGPKAAEALVGEGGWRMEPHEGGSANG